MPKELNSNELENVSGGRGHQKKGEPIPGGYFAAKASACRFYKPSLRENHRENESPVCGQCEFCELIGNGYYCQAKLIANTL